VRGGGSAIRGASRDAQPTRTPSSEGVGRGPLSPQSVTAGRASRVLRPAETLRPLRLLAVGREAPWTVSDRDFLNHAERIEAPIAYLSPNPKRMGGMSRLRYFKYSKASTIREALELGASRGDIVHDYRRGFIRFPKHESDLPATINIDFSLAPEPTRWEETLPEVCSESEKWKEAMVDEIVSMTKFGVYRRLPKSAAGNRQILGCRWVYKGRLTNTVWLFAIALALWYQADVKAAFLQDPLEERIFVRAPPGYSSKAANRGRRYLSFQRPFMA